MRKREKSNLFLKNLAMYVTPVLVPLIILGGLSIFITRRHIVTHINMTNANLLRQTKETVEIILNELDSLNLNFSTNSEIIVRLKRILSNPDYSLQLEDVRSLRSIQHFIGSPANARPYIHSIYVTFENPQARALTSTDGLVMLEDFYDSSWYYEWLNKEKSELIWTELRELKRHHFEKEPMKILTLYHQLRTQGAKGLLMLNIDVDYIDGLLNELETYPGQIIRIVDENNHVIFSNDTTESLDTDEMNRLISTGEYPEEIEINGAPYVISMLTSQRYGWKYITTVPRNALYDIPYKLTALTLSLLLLSLLFGITLTFFITRKNYRYIRNIISIINSAETGSPLPDVSSSSKNEYEYIIENIIKTFIEQRFLQIQLSEKKYRMKTMQLLALQNQINPHFLFNTLETLNWKIFSLTHKTTEANRMVGDLSDILKYCLDDPLNTVTLADEIKNTKSYIEIQKIRYMDKFDVIWKYNESCLSIQVMKLILQPLIENSLYHGIRDKEGRSSIKIKIYERADELKISVIDNGLGISAEELKAIRNELEKDYDVSGSIGLYNINKRLIINYGEQYGAKIYSKKGFGTVVSLRFPKIGTIYEQPPG